MSEFVDHLKGLLEGLGPVSVKRMFGGHGIFRDGLMFGLIADELLYLKADAELAPRFEAENLHPFEYNKNGKVMKMSYFQAPEEFYEDPEVAEEWALLAWEAARRSKRPGKKAKS